jgi:alkylhydroperoxidase family enzyme
MSARSAVALQQGVDEDMLAEVDHYEHSSLSPAQRAALRLADAYLTYPAEMSDAAKQEVAAHLSPVQIVETVLKLMGFSSDKVMVALGLDLDEVSVFTMR